MVRPGRSAQKRVTSRRRREGDVESSLVCIIAIPPDRSGSTSGRAKRRAA